MPFSVLKDRKIDEEKAVLFRGTGGNFALKSADNSLGVLPMQRETLGYRYFLRKPLPASALRVPVSKLFEIDESGKD